MSKTRGREERQAPATSAGAFRLCLTVSGLRCASDGSTLERALKKVDGTRDATVNPIRCQVFVEVDKLVRLEAILGILGRRGYAVDSGDVRVTTWYSGPVERLAWLERRLLQFAGVTSCRVAEPTGRLELSISLRKGWEEAVRDVCQWLCKEAESEAVNVDAREGTMAGGEE